MEYADIEETPQQDALVIDLVVVSSYALRQATTPFFPNCPKTLLVSKEAQWFFSALLSIARILK
jgi:hypothetical protein